ncbi:adenosine kinase [Roseomonas elaeocarpi]|uniref:Adenosine kinase n=1 Tax=Roseomonas elaeocarpi TaxID=907779 RepID=A0ABV6JRR5_9PROT
MTAPHLDILGIGNAIVDVISRAEPALLSARGLTPGEMRLIDTAEAGSLYDAMGPGIESSGGSAANTCAVAAAIGARVGYLGKVADDALGTVFAHDLRAGGIHFPTAPATGGLPTARCLILVTPDGQRTMNTYLGACTTFGPADIDEASVRGAAVTYMEGYLFDPPAAQDAFRTAASIAREAGREVAISLSDAFCVGRHRAAFRDFVSRHADILFANEDEVMSLYEVGSFEAALDAVRRDGIKIAALTRSAAGSVVVVDGEAHAVAAAPATVVDTTGAGDAYAAGFLAAHVRGLQPAERGRWGGIAAAEVIGHLGARPQADLKPLLGLG